MNSIIGHEVVEQRFLSAMGASRLHHAWLIYGQQGIGKASLVKRLAAAYLCEKNRREENQDGHGQAACGECHGCAMLAAESHPDFKLVELLWNEKKKKMNRDIGVDQSRDLLSFLALSGMESQKRVVLLDGAEKMNPQAANALLKGLEEPTQGSLLLIVCHDLMRLPATIRSRCMLEHCSPLDASNMKQVLAGMEIGEKASDLALSLAAGRPGFVDCLQDEDMAHALLAWQALVDDLSGADVGKIQNWLVKNVSIVPHHLIVDVILHPLQERLQQVTSFDKNNALLDASWALTAWPNDVIRHTLRAAPALLTRLLQLRLALRSS